MVVFLETDVFSNWKADIETDVSSRGSAVPESAVQASAVEESAVRESAVERQG